ncbi:MAG TPA: aspartate--tRNA ligase [Gemmatimonadaceae bacterium]|nr:aspartate--tRNA ligase [Gemmatimonadaceae bacterium]
MSEPSPLATRLRSHLCGALRAVHAGQAVQLGGWVHRSRNLGGLVFVDLRDRAGIVQVSFAPGVADREAMDLAERLAVESVVLVEGTVVLRPEQGRNPELATGEVEVQARSVRVVGPAVTPAIPVARGKGEKLAAEELRLRHRILDLRRPELQANLILRHRLMQRARQSLTGQGFVELETPILTKPTPEGARDYLVPSRVHAGEFYALPQSPQIYKQLLMVAGFDRYFQIARCFRDEDLRADRQPEFTQVDIEASFVTQDDVIRCLEAMLVALWDEAGQPVTAPFPRLAWREAMERYGVDKPDLRYAVEITDLSASLAEDAAPFVREAIDRGGRLRGLRMTDAADASRKEIDGMAAAAKEAGAGGLIWAKRTEAGWEGQGVKALGGRTLDALGGVPGELLLAVVGPDAVTSSALHAVRTLLVRRPNVPRLTERAFCWIVDFPLFEVDPESGARVFAHHPFTSPHPGDLAHLDTDPERCRALHYDCVYNGNELGSGSIRITDPALQGKVFELLGIPADEQRRRFGFLLEGLVSGAPPHGGFALGLDRTAMLLAGAGSLRDVIAFPKTTAARALFENAPSPVGPDELRALHLKVCPPD